MPGIATEDLPQEAMEAVDAATLRQKHIRAFARNNTDAVLLAEFDGRCADGTLTAASVHPNPVNTSLGTILHDCVGNLRRCHQESRIHRWLDVLHTSKALAAEHGRQLGIDRHDVVAALG